MKTREPGQVRTLSMRTSPMKREEIMHLSMQWKPPLVLHSEHLTYASVFKIKQLTFTHYQNNCKVFSVSFITLIEP